MKIHVNRGGSPVGQFTEQEILDGHRSGDLEDGDLAWKSGMKEWVPLGQLIKSMQSGEGEGAPSLPGAGDAGFTHFGESSHDEGRGGLPWERREEVGFFGGLFGTIRDVMFAPSEAFSAMKREGGVGSPLFFYSIVGVIGTMAGAFYELLIGGLTGQYNEHLGTGAGTVGMAIGALVGCGFVVILVPLLSFPLAGLTHLSLMLVGGARKSFETTYRTYCYGYGSTSITQLVPLCGPYIYLIWGTFALVVGLSKTHEIGIGRAIGAVAVNFLMCCSLIMMIAIPLVLALGWPAIAEGLK
jgi:hypothetical protein